MEFAMFMQHAAPTWAVAMLLAVALVVGRDALAGYKVGRARVTLRDGSVRLADVVGLEVIPVGHVRKTKCRLYDLNGTPAWEIGAGWKKVVVERSAGGYTVRDR